MPKRTHKGKDKPKTPPTPAPAPPAKEGQANKEEKAVAASGRGRPPIGPGVHVRLDDEVFADLQFICKETGHNLSSLVRTILTEKRYEYLQRAKQLRQTRLEDK